MRFITASALVSPILTTLFAVANADCVPHGPGSCNIVAYSYEPGLGACGNQLNIYDRYCNLIGFSEAPPAGDAVDSQLTYTVVIESFDLSGFDLSFCYADSCYSNPVCSYGGGVNFECQQGFNC